MDLAALVAKNLDRPLSADVQAIAGHVRNHCPGAAAILIFPKSTAAAGWAAFQAPKTFSSSAFIVSELKSPQIPSVVLAGEK